MTAIALEPGARRVPAPKRVRLMPLVALIFFSVSGGAYGIEELFSTSGPGVGLLLIVVTPLIYAIPHSLVVAELGTAIPVEGGYYHWVKRGLGKFFGFQEAMLSWVCSFVDMAIYPVLFTSYLQSLVASVAPGAHVLFRIGHLSFDTNWVICVAVIMVFTAVNLFGAGWVGESSVLFAIFCLLPMLALTVVGIVHLVSHGTNPISEATSDPGQSTWNAFGAGLFIVMWNYCGWDCTSNVAGELENPRRHLPRALAVSVVLIMVGYLLPTIGSLAVGKGGPNGWANWQAGAFSDIARQLAGPWLQWTVTIGGMFSAVALFSALLASNSRLPFVLAKDGYFPGWVSRESRRYRMPVVSIIGSSAIYALFCLSSFTNLIIIDVFLTNVGILLEVFALIALRIREPELERPYRVPGGWWSITAITLLLTGICVWAAWMESGNQYGDGIDSLWYSLWICVGSVALYFPLEWWRASKIRRGTAEDFGPGSPAYEAWTANELENRRAAAATATTSATTTATAVEPGVTTPSAP